MSASTGSGQLPLALRTPPDQRFEAFVDAPAGVIGQLQALATAPSADWVYLSGAPGSGKTHLALAACEHARTLGRSASYLPLEGLAGRVGAMVESLDGQHLVVLDGLDAIAGNRDDEVALFDLHNRARNAGSNLLYIARGGVDAIGLALPDLRSRLAQCVQVSLELLDDVGRAQVLRLRAERRGLVFDPAAIDWLLRRTGRNLGTLTALLDRLDEASLIAQRRVTVPFLRQVLGGLDATPVA